MAEVYDRRVGIAHLFFGLYVREFKSSFPNPHRKGNVSVNRTVQKPALTLI